MQQLLGDQTAPDTSFLRELFLQRLPSNVRMVLASARPESSLQELAELADKVVEVAAPSISAVGPTKPTSEMEQLRAEVARLQISIDALTRNSRSRTSSRSRRISSPSPGRQSSDLCWYHQTYGDAAQKCKPPCTKSLPLNDQANR
jgi:hypothetical protein